MSKVDIGLLVDRIDDLLPQTQCGKCNYTGCKPYAQAIAGDEVPINQCPPGGAAGIQALASLLNRQVIPLNPENGVEKPVEVAIIREDECIGCTKCIAACPVDAILGAAKLMHTVIESICTGCELCVEPCPVDCIDMVAPTSDLHSDDELHKREFARASKRRFESREQRLANLAREKAARLAAKREALKTNRQTQKRPTDEEKRAAIAAAMARVKAKKQRLKTQADYSRAHAVSAAER
ncbi:MAG: electron transport complex subunit RsxB [Pseudomonadota bacterium]